MPIYEYKCKSCSQTFELMTATHSQSIDVECARCNSKDIEKLISASNVATQKAMPDHQGSCCGATPSAPVHSCAGPGSCCGY